MKWFLGVTAHTLRFNHIEMWAHAFRTHIFGGLMRGSTAGTNEFCYRIVNVSILRCYSEAEGRASALKRQLNECVQATATVAETWIESVQKYLIRLVTANKKKIASPKLQQKQEIRISSTEQERQVFENRSSRNTPCAAVASRRSRLCPTRCLDVT